MDGRLVPRGAHVWVRGVSTDTRTLRKGDLFFALRGPNHDGHAYAAEAVRRGARAVVAEREIPAGVPLVIVQDARAALGAFAAAWRAALRGRVIAVTGSNGKTTTKEMIAHLFGRDRRIVCARGSFNNDVGVPLTLLSAAERATYVILEIGTNHPGEIAHLGAMARPDAAVITSVGASHLEGLGSIDGVADEKVSLLGCLRGGGFAVVHHDPRILSRVRLSAERVATFGADRGADLHPEEMRPGEGFTIRGVAFRLELLGAWNVLNALAACSVALRFGISLETCAERLAGFKGPKMRMERMEVAGLTLINDAYNANPESAGRAVREFARFPGGGRRVAVIGEMRELGGASDRYHRELGELLSQSGIDVVVGVGPRCRALLEAVAGGKETHAFDGVEEMRGRLERLFRPGDAVLLKGSRAMGLERLVTWMKERAA